MLLERMGETVTLELADGTTAEVANVLCAEADISDQTVQDVQTRFINQARYKGDQLTLSVLWPTSAPHEIMDSYLWVRGERFAVYGTPFPVSRSPVGYDCQITVTRTLYLYDVELGTSVLERDRWGVHHATWQWVPAKANLLRLAEEHAQASGTAGSEHTLMLEFNTSTWGEGFEAVRYPAGEGNRLYHLRSTTTAREAVLCVFEGGVNE